MEVAAPMRKEMVVKGTEKAVSFQGISTVQRRRIAKRVQKIPR
jgi:DNA-binding transcriptional regulator YbjK